MPTISFVVIVRKSRILLTTIRPASMPVMLIRAQRNCAEINGFPVTYDDAMLDS